MCSFELGASPRRSPRCLLKLWGDKRSPGLSAPFSQGSSRGCGGRGRLEPPTTGLFLVCLGTLSLSGSLGSRPPGHCSTSREGSPRRAPPYCLPLWVSEFPSARWVDRLPPGSRERVCDASLCLLGDPRGPCTSRPVHDRAQGLLPARSATALRPTCSRPGPHGWKPKGQTLRSPGSSPSPSYSCPGT